MKLTLYALWAARRIAPLPLIRQAIGHCWSPFYIQGGNNLPRGYLSGWCPPPNVVIHKSAEIACMMLGL